MIPWYKKGIMILPSWFLRKEGIKIMEIYLIGLAVALVGGLLMSRLTRLLHLPAVTAYLVAGLLLGPFFLGRLNVPGLGFNTLDEVNVLSIVSQTALGFIAFAMGNEFRLSQLRTIGSRAIIIGILQAVITTIVVDVVLLLLHLFFPHIISVPCAITLGAIAAAVLMTAVLPSHKRAELSPTMQKIHDFFNFKTFWMGGILKALYIVSTTASLCAGLYLLTMEPLQGLLFLVLAPVLLRLLYEAGYLYRIHP